MVTGALTGRWWLVVIGGLFLAVGIYMVLASIFGGPLPGLKRDRPHDDPNPPGRTGVRSKNSTVRMTGGRMRNMDTNFDVEKTDLTVENPDIDHREGPIRR